jgi:hypothetical protein
MRLLGSWCPFPKYKGEEESQRAQMVSAVEKEHVIRSPFPNYVRARKKKRASLASSQGRPLLFSALLTFRSLSQQQGFLLQNGTSDCDF